MSKHQELCCGCKYDNIDSDCYLKECCECEFTQGDDNPTNYTYMHTDNNIEKEEAIRTSQIIYEDDYGNYRYGGGFWSGFGDQ